MRGMTRLWHDKAKIVGTREVTDEDGITNNVSEIVAENVPCKVVLKGLKPSNQSFFGTDNYDALLLLQNHINVHAGDIIYITDANGVRTRYKRSSKGYSGYSSHQEVAMVRDEKA